MDAGGPFQYFSRVGFWLKYRELLEAGSNLEQNIARKPKPNRKQSGKFQITPLSLCTKQNKAGREKKFGALLFFHEKVFLENGEMIDSYSVIAPIVGKVGQPINVFHLLIGFPV